MSLASAFGPNSISIHFEPVTFHQAVSLAVGNLIRDAVVTDQYLTDVMDNLQKLGPYFVVAPGVAIAHAKPSSAVLSNGWSLAIFHTGVISGSQNDPVRLVFAFSALDSSSHIESLGQFANWISTPEIVNSLQNASAKSVIRDLLP